MNCTRKHALVTGSSSGIGRATALRLAAAGEHVYAGVRNPADGEQLARSAVGGELTPIVLDVTDASHITAAAEAITRHTGAAGLDGLVNNAGIGLACPSELLPLDIFRRQLEVNVTGQLAITQALLPSLRRACGRIVIVSTIGVRFSPPFAGPLDATKSALTALADALRQELAPWGVRVVLIEPASINSGVADKVARDSTAVMAAAAPERRALYEDTFTRMLAVMQRREGNGSPPDIAAATITEALTAPRPRTMYLTGKDSRRLAILSLLPTPILDAARRRINSACEHRASSAACAAGELPRSGTALPRGCHSNLREGPAAHAPYPLPRRHPHGTPSGSAGDGIVGADRFSCSRVG